MMNPILLITLSFLTGLFATKYWERWVVPVAMQKKKLVIVKDFHIHHSIIGLLMFVAATYSQKIDHTLTALALLGLGLGIIVQHTLSEKRFTFIDKVHDGYDPYACTAYNFGSRKK